MKHKFKSDAEAYRFHRQQNPELIGWIVETALQAKLVKGYKAWSVSAAVEIIRWSGNFTLVRDDEDSAYAINDHVASYYAREIMLNNPELLGFFECRRGAADYEPLGVNGQTWFDYRQTERQKKINAANARREAREAKKKTALREYNLSKLSYDERLTVDWDEVA